MIAVSDASPLHYLLLLGYADILPAIFSQVLIPPAVLRELQHPDAPVRVRDRLLSMPGWISLQPEPFPPLLDLPGNLHAGETQAIQLAHHRQIPVVLLDDLDARRAAERRQFVVAGTLRLLAEGSLAGLLSLREAFGRLKQTNFRASERLYTALLVEIEGRGSIFDHER